MAGNKNEDVSLKEHFDIRFDEMERRFDENTKEHETMRKEYRSVNKSLNNLRQEVANNTEFRCSYQPIIDKLANDRERKVRKILDLVFVLIIVAAIIIVGLDNYSFLVSSFL